MLHAQRGSALKLYLNTRIAQKGARTNRFWLLLPRRRLNTELNGLPGGRMDPEDGGEAQPTAQHSTASPPTVPRPPRGRPMRPMSAGPTGAAKAAAAAAAGPAEPSSDPRVLLQGTADLVRQLRAMDMDR